MKPRWWLLLLCEMLRVVAIAAGAERVYQRLSPPSELRRKLRLRKPLRSLRDPRAFVKK